MQDFVEVVWDYYAHHGRTLPWRQPESNDSFDPYKILVSEIMLQQTQVSRVTQKYQEFLSVFPTVESLAQATLGEVLKLWQGLGYNRRAKFLWQAAQMVTTNYNGKFPEDQKELSKLPGVGVNTAGAICAYAYNKPVIFIETNIRSVYIHHFFKDGNEVDDKELIPLIERSLDFIDGWEEQPVQKSHFLPGAITESLKSLDFRGKVRNPEKVSHYREWYWALMDYGSHLKSEYGNTARASKHYAKQSAFQGSKRQVRGQVLKLLVTGQQTTVSLQKNIPDSRLKMVLVDLANEDLIVRDKHGYRLA